MNRYLQAFIILVLFTVPAPGAEADRPTLEATRNAGGQVVLHWSDPRTAMVESSPRLGTQADWQPITEAIDPALRTVTLSPTGVERFFRLRVGEPLTRVIHSSPQRGEQGISVLREVVLTFSDPLPPSVSLTTSNFFAEANDRKLLTRIHMGVDRQSATLFYLEPVPGSARVRVQLNSDGFPLDAAARVDFDGNSIPGGTYSFVYGTHGISASTNTAISGRVLAAEQGRDASGNPVDRPLRNVTITVDGAEESLRTVTDAAGYFRLEPCPAGTFFVHVDGRTSTESNWPSGDYYPVVGKSWVALEGRSDNLANENGIVYLPFIPAGTLTPVSMDRNTVVSLPGSVLAAHPEWQGVEVDVPPGALISESGIPGGSVGIAIVPSNRLPSPLPVGLRLPVVITVQTDGPLNFSEPVRARFPNLPDPLTGQVLGPGEKLALWSFNHDSGRWEVQGPATVTSDGRFVESDPGFGIRQPGWHGVAPGVPASTPPPELPCSSWTWVDILDALDQNRREVEGTAAETLAFQIYCITAQAAQNANTWGGGWVMEVLQGVACNAQNGTLQDYAQYPCSLVPGGVPIYTSTSVIPPNLYYNVIFTGDVCFAAEGFGYHTIFELLPAFWEQICQMTDAQHNDFINHGILPCLAGNPALGPTMTSIASLTVPPILVAIREAMQAAASCGDNPGQAPSPLLIKNSEAGLSPLPGLPRIPTEAELRLPELDEGGTLQIDTGGRFFISVGETVQLKVSREGQDITTHPDTHYSAFIGSGSASVTSDGKVTVHSTSNSLPILTPTFYVAVWNATNAAMAQFAMKDVDSDGDWMVDSYERAIGLDPGVPSLRGQDSDNDGLSDLDEIMRRTLPTQPDTDGDGLSDADEVLEGWDPTLPSSPSLAEKAAQGPYFSWIEDLELDFDARTYVASADANVPDQILAPERRYRRWIYTPTDGRRGSIEFVSSPIGTSMTLPQPAMRAGNSPDSDQDGLDDEAEAIVGTNPSLGDTDGDGVTDFVEIQQGRDPLSQLGLPVGLISNLELSGTAQGILREGNLVYVSVGTEGVVVVDVSNPVDPKVVTQLDLPGLSFAMAISPVHRIAAVAAGSESVTGPDAGVHLLDVSVPATLRLLRTIPIPVQTITEHRGCFIAGLRKEFRILDALTGAELAWAPTRSDILGVTAVEDRLYAATQEGLEIFDLSTAMPTFLGGTNTPNTLVWRFYEGDMIVTRGVLHAGTARGYLTMDVSDPARPTQLALSQRTPVWIMHGLALNGSGKMGTLISFGGGARELAVFDATNPLDADRFLTSFSTEGPAHDLDFKSGLVFVADARFGLSIFNTATADTLGVPPTVSVDFSQLDQDSGREGIQVIAGSSLTVEADVRDDLQMREASLWVNGLKSAARDTGPVIFPLEIPGVIPDSGVLTVQVQATDLGGATGQSPVISLQVVTNAARPALRSSYPRFGGVATSLGLLVLEYDQSIQTNSLALSEASLLDLGADGSEGGGDDTPVAITRAEAKGRLVYLYPATAMRSAQHLLIIGSNFARNRAGNSAPQEIRIPFSAWPLSVDDQFWSAGIGGRFDVATNWIYGRVPGGESAFIPILSDSLPILFSLQDFELQRFEHHPDLVLLPGAELSVGEEWIAHGSVTLSNALAVIESSAQFERPLILAGGSIINLGVARFDSSLEVTRGGEFIMDGPAARLDPETALSGRSFTFTVRNGGSARLPQFVDFADPGDFTLFRPVSSTFSSRGSGSRLVLPELNEIWGPTNWNVRSVPSLTLDAFQGGIIEAPRLEAAHDRVLLRVSGGSSSIVATNLGSIDGPVSDFLASLSVASEGELQLSSHTLVQRCDVELNQGGIIRCGTLELGETASLGGSGTLAGSLVARGRLILDTLPDPLVIEGNLELVPASVTEVTIGTWNSALQAAQVSVRGTMSLNGQLKVVIPRNVQLNAGEEYTIATVETLPSGAFASLDDEALGATLKAEVVNAPGAIKLRISLR